MTKKARWAEMCSRPAAGIDPRGPGSHGIRVCAHLTRASRDPSFPDLFLSDQRNALRLPSDWRTGLRVNKIFFKGRRRLTLFAEVINLFNRDNVRFDDYGSYDSRTGRTRVSLDKTFPILPSAGIVLEF